MISEYKSWNNLARHQARRKTDGRGVGANGNFNHTPMEIFDGKQVAGAAPALNKFLSNDILTALPGEDFMRLLPALEPIALAGGKNIDQSNGGGRFVYFPEDAVLSQLCVLEDGSTTEAALVGRDGLIGLFAIFNSPPTPYMTQVTIAGTVLRVKADFLIREFSRGKALQQVVLDYARARIVQVSQRAVCNGRHSVGERLCSWLLMIRDRAGADQLPLTHEQIAGHLGVRRSGITNAANEMRDRKIISYSRGRISIIDRSALESAACECYEVLGQRPLPVG